VINNDVLRRVRYMLSLDDAKMIEVFAAAEHTVERQQIRDWLAGDDDFLYQEMPDSDMARFLNGLIVARRGRRPGPLPEPESRLTNNLIAMKLRIALELQGPDLIDMLSLAGMELSNHELSAFFRKPGHKHYRVMQDQVLRYLLRGMQRTYRPSEETDD